MSEEAHSRSRSGVSTPASHRPSDNTPHNSSTERAPGNRPLTPTTATGPPPTEEDSPPTRGRLTTAETPRARDSPRSEEHTSELQSRFDLVCRLLLEKKKNIPPTK